MRHQRFNTAERHRNGTGLQKTSDFTKYKDPEERKERVKEKKIEEKLSGYCGMAEYFPQETKEWKTDR